MLTGDCDIWVTVPLGEVSKDTAKVLSTEMNRSLLKYAFLGLLTRDPYLQVQGRTCECAVPGDADLLVQGPFLSSLLQKALEIQNSVPILGLIPNHFLLTLYVLVFLQFFKVNSYLTISDLLFPHPATLFPKPRSAGLTPSHLLCVSLNTTFQENLPHSFTRFSPFTLCILLYNIYYNYNYVIIVEVLFVFFTRL